MSSIKSSSNSEHVLKYLDANGFGHLKKKLKGLNGKDLLSKDRKFFEQLEKGTELYNLLHPKKSRFKIFTFLIFLSLILILVTAIFLFPLLKTATSCYAKTICSETFVAKRDPSTIDIGKECSFPLLPKVVFGEIDYETKTVVSMFKALIPVTSTARFHNKCVGCSLDNDYFYNGFFNENDRMKCENAKSEPLVIGNNKSIHDKIDAIIKPFFENNTLDTREVVILQNGELIYEKYKEGFTSESPLIGYSMTKSVLNALIGLRIKDKKLSLDDYAYKYIPQWKNDMRSKITINDLLKMSSGLQWAEVYDILNTDVVPMLYVEPTSHYRAINKPLVETNDTIWYYSSGTSNILSYILRRTFDNTTEYLEYPFKRLFNEIGATSFTMETDPFGTFVASSFSYATARDWARFGQLFLNDGVWNGKRILPEGWVKYTTTPVEKSFNIYGAHWWLGSVDKDVPEFLKPLQENFSLLGKNSFLASGYGGQFTVIVPELNLVFVRLGFTINPMFPIGNVVKSIVDVLKNE